MALVVALGAVPAASSWARSAAERSTAEPEATEPSETTEPDAATEPSAFIEETSAPGPTLEDGVLPCGVRVIIAQDSSLPVAAVVLALDTGTEDDPASQPGLVHALAYHLLQGNRELRPAGAAALVHDRGGIASLAIGPAQIRFESLVPISALSDILWAESQRLRAPTVSAELWSSTLRWARRDKAQRLRIPRAAMAVAHDAPGLDHEGRAVSPPLQQMVPRAIAQALAQRFRYETATLVVVSPHPPAELRPQIEALFEDLPPKARTVRDRSPRWRSDPVPRTLAIQGEKGQRFVWPVQGDPASLGWATVWCKAINRQRRISGEPARARLRCHLDVDPRRATLVLLATGVEDPLELVQTRVGRLQNGEDVRLIERQRKVVARDWTLSLRTSLPLAQRLATAGPVLDLDPGWHTRPQHWLSGLAELTPTWTAGRSFGPQLDPGAALHLVAKPSEESDKP